MPEYGLVKEEYKWVDGKEFMGFEPSLSSNVFFFVQNYGIYPVQFQDDQIVMDYSRAKVCEDRENNERMWTVREIYFDELVIGYFNRAQIRIYEHGIVKQEILHTRMNVFGFLTPP